MASERKIRVAQVGVGHFGAYRRARLRETGVFELVASYDLNPAAMAAAEKEDGARPTESYEALLDTPGIEAMIVSTGGKFHAEQALAAMERGLHVFVEKPLCSTPEETAALLQAQRRTGLVVGVGHNDHSHDAVSGTIKRLIDSGELGTVATFEKTTSHSGGLQMKPDEWRADPEKNPGGMLFQCGVHGFHELMYYFGPITRASCRMRYDVHVTRTADVALCHIEFASGLIGCLNAYHVTPYRHTFNIFGTRTNLYRDERFFDEGTTLLAQSLTGPGNKEPKVPVEITGKTDIRGNVRSFYNAIVNGGTPYPSLEDGARAVAVVFAADRSARTGESVDVDEMMNVRT